MTANHRPWTAPGLSKLEQRAKFNHSKPRSDPFTAQPHSAIAIFPASAGPGLEEPGRCVRIWQKATPPISSNLTQSMLPWCMCEALFATTLGANIEPKRRILRLSKSWALGSLALCSAVLLLRYLGRKIMVCSGKHGTSVPSQQCVSIHIASCVSHAGDSARYTASRIVWACG